MNLADESHQPRGRPGRATPTPARTWDNVGVIGLTVALPALFAFMFSVGLGRRSWHWLVLLAMTLVLVLIAPILVALLARLDRRSWSGLLRRADRAPDQHRSTIEELVAHFEVLVGEFATARGQAEGAAHPLLAEEFATIGERLAELLRQAPTGGAAGGPASTRWLAEARSMIRPGGDGCRRRLRRRLRVARLAYRWNLPLTRGAAANFAVATMAARIDRWTDVISGYLAPAQPARGGSDV